jgi:chromate transporter
VKPDSQARRLRELAMVFLKLGCIGFGGPAAHIGLIEEETVRRRGWLSHEKFLEYLAAANLIPGPNSTELAIFIGRERAGCSGLLVAGTCFILPAMLIVMGIGWSYQRYGELPAVGGVLYGVKPVIVAVVAQALWALGRSSVKNFRQAALFVVAFAAVALGAHELVILLAAGLVGLAWHLAAPGRRAGGGGMALALPWLPVREGMLAAAVPATTAVASAPVFGLLPLFLFFLKVGAVLYGSGYVLLAFLRADLVERWHWLTEGQLLDAVAVGQVTPGPLFTTATFIGYVLGGWPAALVATAGIFLPAFVFVAVCSPWLPWLRQSKPASAFLDGVVVASLALMAWVSWHLGRAALVDVPTVVLALAGAGLLLRFKVNSAWLVLGGAIAGLTFSWLAR